VCPRSFDLACLIFADMTVFKPTLRLILLLLCDTQSIRKLVTISEPRSPLFPLVSSTLLIESIQYRYHCFRKNNSLPAHNYPLTYNLLSFATLQ
jgi:hypothetical protein